MKHIEGGEVCCRISSLVGLNLFVAPMKGIFWPPSNTSNLAFFLLLPYMGLFFPICRADERPDELPEANLPQLDLPSINSSHYERDLRLLLATRRSPTRAT